MFIIINIFSSCSKEPSYTFEPYNEYIELESAEELNNAVRFDVIPKEELIDFDEVRYIFIDSVPATEIIYKKGSDYLVFIKLNGFYILNNEERKEGCLSFYYSKFYSTMLQEHNISISGIPNKRIDLLTMYSLRESDRSSDEEASYTIAYWYDSYVDSYIFSTVPLSEEQMLRYFHIMEGLDA